MWRGDRVDRLARDIPATLQPLSGNQQPLAVYMGRDATTFDPRPAGHSRHAVARDGRDPDRRPGRRRLPRAADGSTYMEGDGTTVIRMDTCSFAPTVSRVAAGTTVRFLNTATIQHQVVGRSATWGSVLLDPGQDIRRRSHARRHVPVHVPAASGHGRGDRGRLRPGQRGVSDESSAPRPRRATTSPIRLDDRPAPDRRRPARRRSVSPGSGSDSGLAPWRCGRAPAPRSEIDSPRTAETARLYSAASIQTA